MERVEFLERLKSILTEEDYLFIKIFSQKVDPKIGEIVNISDETIDEIKKIINKYCINPKSNFNVNKIVGDYKSGISLTEIVDRYNIDRNKIAKILRKQLGYKKIYDTISQTQNMFTNKEEFFNVGKRWTDEEESELFNSYIKGENIFDIANRHKRGVGGIRSRLRNLGFALPNEELLEEWQFSNRPDRILSSDQIKEFCEPIIDELNERIRNYLAKKKTPFVVGDENYNTAKIHILFVRYNIKLG